MTPGVLDSAPRAAKKLQALADVAEENEAVLRATSFKLSALRTQATASSAEAGIAIGTEIRRQEALLESRRATYLEADGVAQRCRTFLTMLPPGKVLVDAPVPSIKEQTRGGFKAAVERVRSEIGGTLSALRAAQTAPLPVEFRKARLREHIEALAKAHTPRISVPQDGPVSIELPDPRNTLGILSAFVPDQVIERFNALVDRMPESPHALAPDTRAARIAELTTKLDELERREEFFIERAANDEGQTIARRLNASPIAILGALIQPKAPVAKKPERTIAAPAATAVA